MNIDERLIVVMTELLAEVHEMRIEIKGMRSDFNTQIDMLGNRVERLEKEQAKTNLGIQELRLSVMKLAENDERIIRLENEVFRKAS